MHPAAVVASAGLITAEQCWLYSHLVTFAEMTGLIVLKTPLLRVTDPIFKPVAAVLGKMKHDLLIEYEAHDPSMIFGKVKVELYRFLDDLDQPLAIPDAHEVFRERGLGEMGLLPLDRLM